MSLIIKNLNYAIKDQVILNNLNIAIEKNSFTLINGPSGSGKSTLFHLISNTLSNLNYQLEGEILIDDLKVSELNNQSKALKLCLLFQNPDLQFCMDTVFNELVFCLENLNQPLDVFEKKIDQALQVIGIEALKHRLLTSLSGGQKQLVALACALVLDSEYLLLDEPFANVDPQKRKAMLDLLKKLQKDYHKTIIIIDHDISELKAYVDTCFSLDNQGNIKEVEIDSLNKANYQVKLSQLDLNNTNLKLKHFSSLINNQQLTNYQFDLMIPKQAVVAITGASGSGKTTFLNGLARINHYHGSCLLDNQELKKYKNKDYLSKLAYAFQNPIDQFLFTSLELELNSVIEDKQLKTKILNELALTNKIKESPFVLSQGQQRRFALALVLAKANEVVLCDEPTYGQDYLNTQNLIKMLQEHNQKYHSTIIYTTHDLALAKSFSHIHLHLENQEVKVLKGLEYVK